MTALVNVVIPLRTQSTNHGNGREHWRARAARVKAERNTVALYLATLAKPLPPLARVVVTLSRIAPRTLDDDNVRGALKAVRDEVAALLGRDDGPKAGIEWRYTQERGRPREYAVRIRIAHADEVPA